MEQHPWFLDRHPLYQPFRPVGLQESHRPACLAITPPRGGHDIEDVSICQPLRSTVDVHHGRSCGEMPHGERLLWTVTASSIVDG
jgi:hypothetical protein